EAPREYGDDLAGALRAARRGGDGYAARWRAEVRRLRSSAGEVSGGNGCEATAEPSGGPGAQAGRAEGPDGPDAQAGRPEGPDGPDAQAGRAGAPDVPVGPVAGEDARAGLVAALAFPERVARADGGSYLMVSGTRAEPGEGTALPGAPWIAVAVADRPVGRGHARVRLGAAVDEAVARYAAGALADTA